jgi:hypothetical protein
MIPRQIRVPERIVSTIQLVLPQLQGTYEILTLRVTNQVEAIGKCIFVFLHKGVNG